MTSRMTPRTRESAVAAPKIVAEAAGGPPRGPAGEGAPPPRRLGGDAAVARGRRGGRDDRLLGGRELIRLLGVPGGLAELCRAKRDRRVVRACLLERRGVGEVAGMTALAAFAVALEPAQLAFGVAHAQEGTSAAGAPTPPRPRFRRRLLPSARPPLRAFSRLCRTSDSKRSAFARPPVSGPRTYAGARRRRRSCGG